MVAGVTFPSDLAASLLRGEVTLANVYGLDQDALYEIANIGFRFLTSGKLSEARQIYQGLVAADPFDSVFHCHLGATHQKLGEFDQAFEQYETALRLNQANVDALAGRGEIHLIRGALVQGVSDLRRALELDREAVRPSTARAHKLLSTLRQLSASA